jgi:hypothetical protein
MWRLMVLGLFVMLTLSAFAGTKDSGSTVLKDVQPAGTPDKKQKQQYDLSFASASKSYTCRTGQKNNVNATDFGVGSTATYQINGNKGKIKTSAGKQVHCTIVRVSDVVPESK